jgi:hypothetical protein
VSAASASAPSASAPAPSVTAPAAPSASASAPASPVDAEGRLSSEHPYHDVFWKEVNAISGADCTTGWTGSAYVKIDKAGKIVSWTDTEGKASPKLVGKKVTPPPSDLAAFFDRTTFVGICAYYVNFEPNTP